MTFAYSYTEFNSNFWNSRFGQVLTPLIVELLRGVEKASEPLMRSICTHTTLLCSERRHSMSIHVKMCWRNVEKSPIRQTQ